MARKSFVTWIVLLVTLLAACAPAATPAGSAAGGESAPSASTDEPKAGGTLTVALNGEIDTIDPHMSVTIVGFQVYTQIFEGLVQQTPTLDGVEPLLAESWEQPDDLTYLFTLRQGVKFHNGADFTAKDVEYTFNHVMDEATGSPRRADFLPVDTLEVVDDYTVKFTMKEPFAPFLTKLETLRIVPADPSIDTAQAPVGTGPFKFVEWISGQQITLAKNETYWQAGLPYLDEVIFRPIPEPSTRVVELQTNNVDLLNELPFKDVKTLEDDPNMQVFRVMGVVRDHLGFNMEHPTFKDNPNLRKAIAWAIDRQTIADTIMFGLAQPAQVAIPTNNWGYNPAAEGAYGYDLAKAQEYYDQADPKPTELTVKVSPTYPDEVKMAELLQQDLSKIGINLNIVQLEWSTWIQQVVSDGDYEMEIVLISGGSDPDDFFYQWHHTGEVFNLWRYSDPEMDQMLEEARALTDQTARQEIYHQIQSKLLEDVPLTHIIYRESVMASTTALQNFTMTGRYDMDFREVWLDR
ncbi:MAG: ABC transporter substrate-binding protein [Caldilineaceae bacterium]